MVMFENPPNSARHAQQDCARRARPRVQGKFISVDDKKLYIRGVTYGSFRPEADGHQFPGPEVVEADFAAMAANNLNAVRTYSVPPLWLLDAALRHGLYVMVGLPWEQHVAFLDDRKLKRSIEAGIRDVVRSCAGHRAILCYALGNEIPASIVRWHGAARVQRFIERLYEIGKSEDPVGLFTYVNYPSTEYLSLPFLDFVCFNVYLENQKNLESYLARLQNIAGDRPLMMAEIGLDSRRNGELRQAETLDWQVRATFAAGCAGAFVFSWTDEWFRGGFDVDDWDFGLTTRDRRQKPALASVSRAFAEVPFPADLPWPKISVVVCSYNGSRTIRECFEGLARLEYPNYEVIVVNDGSTDATAAIASEYDARLISTENRGLSNARNTGMEAATGEIIAYIDDDASPDPHWLTYLAVAFQNSTHAGIGGPNIAPPGDGHTAHCVAHAPGNPVHILLSDHEAEHIPGCNMAFRKACLQEVGGFDPQLRVAGDDVDLCWRLQERGWTLGFSPAAMVWHHRRNSVRAYWKQQQGYGKAEGMLERKWPEKYNSVGHVSWTGRVYGNGFTQMIGRRRGRIYQGTWGSALFQSIYQPAPNGLRSLPMMPEWYLVITLLAVFSALGFFWRPLFLTAPLLVAAVGALLAQAVLNAAQSPVANATRSRFARVKLRMLTAFLHLFQPLARLRGRLGYGLTPWRARGSRRSLLPLPRTINIWREHWQAPDKWLERLEVGLRSQSAIVRRGGDFDRWDLEVRGGIFGRARLLMAIEEHGAGKQLARFQLWPKYSLMALALPLLCIGLSIVAGFDHARLACPIFAALALLLCVRAFREGADVTGTLLHALREMKNSEFATRAVLLEQPLSESIRPVLSQSPIARKDHAIAQPKPLAAAAAAGQRTSL
jgi:GT2 family glycosyltransferase